MMISQARVSPSISFYQERFHRRYGLKPYTNAFIPTIFFGCYTSDDLFAIGWHQGGIVMVWAGTDAKNILKFKDNKSVMGILTRPNMKHVAISKFIADDLDALGIPYTRLPLCNVDESRFKPTPRGKAVYVYLPDHDRAKYGGEMVDSVRAALPDVEFIIQSKLDPSADMPGLYAKCGVGLRLLEHDGLSNTCVELGLAGRRVIWNGDTPNALPYETVEDVVRLIRQELGRPDDTEQVASAMAAYITLPQQWKTVEFYTQKPIGIIPQEVANCPYEYGSYFDARYRSGERGAGGPDPESNEAKWTQDRIVDAVNEAECESVVEVGCGAAVRWDNLPSNDYTGVDVSAEALKHAGRKFPEATWLVRDATKEAFPYGDAVLCLDVLQHIRPGDYDSFLNRLFTHANKLLIIKTSICIPTLKYQFDHGAPIAADGWDVQVIKVPDSAPSFMFIFHKQTQEAVA